MDRNSLSLYSFLGVCVLGIIALGVRSCGGPYALNIRQINYSNPQISGPIQFTDPKLYKREALINERNKEVAYLDKLLVESEASGFNLEPEIIRDLDTITSLTGGVVGRSDPASAMRYTLESEKYRTQQNADLLRLQVEVDVLQRQLDSQRNSLSTGNDGVAQGAALGETYNAHGASGSTNTETVNTVGESITRINAAESTRLEEISKRGTEGEKGSNPTDAFLDRAAYRTLVNSARNAASLDELHDKDGAALIRLYFSATVLPPPEDYANALGVLRMEVAPPDWTDENVSELYLNWLNYINRILNVRDFANKKPLTFRENVALGSVREGDLFDVVYYYYPLDKAECGGVSFDNSGRNGCGILSFAVPRAKYKDRLANALVDTYANLTKKNTNEDYFQKARNAVANAPRDVGNFGKKCSSELLGDKNIEFVELKGNFRDALGLAIEGHFLLQALVRVDSHAQGIMSDNDGPKLPPSKLLEDYRNMESTRKGELLLGEFLAYKRNQGCKLGLADLVKSSIPNRFDDMVRREGLRVAIYEVNPHEQAQRIGTAVRAADAISLATALSAQLPSSGIGAEGALDFSRSAVGKADALERVPLAVSFAEAKVSSSNHGPAFGWVLGPRVSIDPSNNSFVLTQQLKTYDLSVDLAVPGWWPYLYLDTQSAWSPDWNSGSGKTLASGIAPKRIKVSLGNNSSDLAALTSMIGGGAFIRVPVISNVYPESISACAGGMFIQVVGDNIWRANTIILGGRKVSGGDVTVLPDMNGILVSLGTGLYPAIDEDGIEMTVLTPYGRATKKIKLKGARADGTCDAVLSKSEGGG
ncbi:hypothetical protein [Pseudomonas sp. C9]|uniref:hypothetical protein n=1 Tax=Pseudomonas sp. C9 TaxID=1311337 RepID=UPI000984EA33|nr:hypothetical protein [Pseudomonas sp. C9]OOG15064.1 hypothetical protein BMS17_24210 [Pseudomonas sp. C9]